MAYDTLRASGNNQYGQMSDVERANFGSAQSAQDFILRKRLQDEALARQDASQDKAFTHADQSQARAFAEGRVTGGTFEDRERLADARIDRAVAPALLHEQNAQADWQAMRDDTQGQREANAQMMKLRNSVLGRIGPMLTGEGGATMDSKTLRMLAPFAGVNNVPSDPEDDMIRGVLSKLAGEAAGSGDIPALKQILGASSSGDINQIPTNIGPTPQALSSADVGTMLSGKVADFAKRANNTFGYNPTSDDMESIVQARDQLAKAKKAEQPRLDIKDAIAAANQIIDAQLLQSGAIKTWAGGGQRVRELRQRLGLVAGD